MLSDIEIAQNAKLLPITDIASQLDINEDELILYGNNKAKISNKIFTRLKDKENGKLILVTAINPTKAGEGKSTVTIGLTMALNSLGKNSIAALREPSLGPVFGIKGGAAGGGYCQVLPMEDINLHFTGDLHAITSANNLLCAMIDNHINHGNSLNIDSRKIIFKRALDMNDRALRNVVVGLGSAVNGFVREDSFHITVASEVMAILCLAENLQDLKERFGKIIVAYDMDNNPVTAADLNAHGAMAALMKDAINPNLVQTIENTPAIIHGGPFANIAHGCNSVIATKLALKLSDYVVTEAGFGADLGAEKFLDIKCQSADIKPDCIVLVATVRALKLHGNVEYNDLNLENTEALTKGFENLLAHYNNLKKYNVNVVVSINKFATDTENEISCLKELCKKNNIKVSVNDGFVQGSKGVLETAKDVIEAVENSKNEFKPLYENSLPVKEKIEKIAKEIYHAKEVEFSSKALKDLKQIEKLGYNNLPVCIAKTQYSFSDEPSLLGAPKDFTIHVQNLTISAGAGFIVVLTGNIMTMPGLPKKPAAENIDIDEKGNITGLF